WKQRPCKETSRRRRWDVMNHKLAHAPRGLVILIVLWAIAIAAIVTSAVQLHSFRQAMLGRESLERIQARWAARSGIEDTIAVMTDMTERPVPDDAKAIYLEMEKVAQGDTLNASYDIRHQTDGRDYLGPMDEQSKLNINRLGATYLMVDDEVTPDQVDALRDWMDQDDQVSTFGVESDWYQSRVPPYEARNGNLLSITELEMVAGIAPEYARGEDFNGNNRLDPNENDGDLTAPPDNRDGQLQYGYEGYMSAFSYGGGGATDSGQPRIYVAKATADELTERLKIDQKQAEAIISMFKTAGASLDQLYTQQLGQTTAPTSINPGQTNNQNQSQTQSENQNQNQNSSGKGSSNSSAGATSPLTAEQIVAATNELTTQPLYERQFGKININTVSADLLRKIFEFRRMDESLADELLYLRDAKPTGITDLADFRKIGDLSDQDYRSLIDLFCTKSNVFTISSRGRSWGSGMEVEIIVTVDRSTIPVQILEYREQ
ncbi:MAG TPA: hypothetical protein VG711_08625, partial [Phycisphaerales bacterium]|nr:hypothetical protein [Phycisphaerales bacterium]